MKRLLSIPLCCMLAISPFAHKLRQESMTTNYVWVVPVSTFISGFLSFTVISIHEGSFWGNSNYDIPLILAPAVIIGDLILLPTINYLLFDLSLNSLGLTTLMKYKSRMIKWCIGSTTIALLFTSLVHYAWANDAYTDHISFKQGHLSFGGWWHFIFSYIQNILFFMFIAIWSVAIDEENKEAIEKSHQIWKNIFIFSTLLPLNFMCQFFYGIYGNDFIHGLIQAKFTFSITIVSVLVLLSMNIYSKKALSSAKLEM